MSVLRCTFGSGNSVCGAVLQERRGPFGALQWDCPQCERRRAGKCRRCPRPVVGKVGRAVYCAECRQAKKREDALNGYFREHERNKKRGRQRRAKERKGRTGSSRPMTPSERGRIGGLAGGKARLGSMTLEQRREFSRRGGKKGGAIVAATRTREEWSALGKKGCAVRWAKQKAS